jgi:membrane-associated phospholipid phosphatase
MGVAAWIALLGAAVALSILAAHHDALPGDTAIMSYAQDRVFPGQHVSDAIRAITSTELVLATGAVIALALWFSGRRQEAVALAAGLVVLPLLQAGLKDLVDRPRPMEPGVELRASFSSESFPAGHVMSPTYLYAVLIGLAFFRAIPDPFREPVGLFAALIIVFSGVANVWLGVHWPSDVLGGWAWGLLLAGLVLLAVDAPRRIRR